MKPPVERPFVVECDEKIGTRDWSAIVVEFLE